MNKPIILASSLLILNFPSVALQTSSTSVSQAAVETSSCEIKAENGDSEEYSSKQLQTLASRITVKVIGDNNGGSGTLLAKQGNTYLVLTNSHVVRGVNSISLQTSDGKSYPAQIVTKTNFEKFDLALLQFQSNQNYCLPKEIAQSVPNTETPVLAAGYSSQKGQIVFRTGIVQQIASRPLKEGYSIGYTSEIEQGMSGGAILNSLGQLIGINGRSAYPILNTGYVYPDGSRPTQEEIKKMRSVSWGIPVSTVLAQVNTEILIAYSLPVSKDHDRLTQIQLTGWLGELEQKAKQITVRIDSSSNANGSGIIIAKDGDTYTVLTASHVVCEREDATKSCGNYNYQILAPDGKQYPVEKSTIKTEEGLDLAIVKFTASKQTYQVATLANYNPNNYDYMFTAGYPNLRNNSPWRFTMGQIFDKERGIIEATQSDLPSDSSGSLQSTSSLTKGYELVYTSITYGGMSGGPVLDSQGRVIGIHGSAEADIAYDEKTDDCGVASKSECQSQIGYSLGVPVSTFLGLATRFGVQAQKVENIKPPELDFSQLYSIQKVVLSADVSKGNTTASQWLERGNQLWRLGRYEEAVTAFDAAIKLKPSFVYLAYYGKGLALDDQRKYQEAQAALEAAVRYNPNFVIAWLYQSSVYRRSNQLDKALVAINKAIQLQPKKSTLYNSKSGVLMLLKRYKEAETAINEAIRLHPRAAFFNTRGHISSEQKKWELALSDFNNALAINPQYTYAYNNRGNIYKEQKKWELALSDFNNVIAINPQYADAYVNRGNLYKKLQKWDLALSDYNKALTINFLHAGAFFNRGILYHDQKKWDLALSDYNRAIAINPQYSFAYNNRGNLYKEQKKWDLALSDYNNAIAINPQYVKAYNNRGVLYANQKKWDLALSDYNNAITINPQYSDAYINRGILYYEQKKWDLALSDFNKAIAINPTDANAYNNRGILYSNQKKWDLALSDFNKAIAINPTDANAYNNRGVLYVDQKKWNLALSDYNKAIAINPKYDSAHNNRGFLYYKLQKWDLSEADYSKAIEMNSQYTLAYNNRVNLYHEQKKWDLALSDYNKLIAINPQDTNAYNNRGNLYADQKKWDLALSNYNKAIAINPTHADAYNNRGFLYYKLQKWDLSEADYSKAIEINPQYTLAYNNRGNLYADQKKWNLALSDYNKAIAINPTHADAYNNRGFLYYKLQKWDLSEADYSKAIKINHQFALAYNNRGLLYHKLQKWDLALADFNQAIKINHQFALAYNNRGLLYNERGDKQRAVQDLQQGAQLFYGQGKSAAYEQTINILKKLQR
ncbi:MAG: tetratricopeptide repeat protein [Scytonema hyalinum WJT4-NPBG1]|jgi:tetratricopeptide (TPR) repeat protein/S1-C subfamily serine protease|nr:tetratricopeptide repeat protein [Scytonema hyalinum WJT4-NPBG1]